MDVKAKYKALLKKMEELRKELEDAQDAMRGT